MDASSASKFKSQIIFNCRAQIKVLEQALKFSQDNERQLRERLDAIGAAGLSWAGFNLSGDRKSIDEVKRMMHSEKYLKQCDAILRERIAHLEGCIENWDRLYTSLETKLKFDSAHYPEGFRWDIDDYPAQQKRRWNPETRELEPGHDPPFVAPPAVPFKETDNAA